MSLAPLTYPPGPHGLRLVRLLWTHRKDPFWFLVAMGAEYGDIVHFRLGPRHVFLVKDPESIQEVLVLKHSSFVKGLGYQWAKRYLGEGLLTNEGENHAIRRRLILPAFHRTRLSGYAQAMVAHSQAFCWQRREGETLDMARAMRGLALTIVAKTLFSADVGQEAEEIDEALSSIVAQFPQFYRTALPLASLIDRLPLPSNVQFNRAVSRLEATVRRLVDARRSAGEERDDLLSMLLSAQGADEHGACRDLTDTDIRDEVLTLLLTGHETTANVLTWTWYLLSRHPEAEWRLHQELSTVLRDRLPTSDDVARLPYTHAVFAETLRLFPPALGFGRRAIADTWIGGVPIPKGSSVIVSPYVTHRDPRWFPDPERFDPGRWMANPQPARPEFAYFPFGGGPRRCVGEDFARMEGVLVIATVAQQWQFRAVPGHPVQPQGLVALRPKSGMLMQVERRQGV